MGVMGPDQVWPAFSGGVGGKHLPYFHPTERRGWVWQTFSDTPRHSLYRVYIYFLQ